MTSYCTCGQRIDRQYEWNGIASVPTYWQIDGPDQITHCPGCGEWLTESGLANHPPSEDEDFEDEPHRDEFDPGIPKPGM